MDLVHLYQDKRKSSSCDSINLPHHPRPKEPRFSSREGRTPMRPRGELKGMANPQAIKESAATKERRFSETPEAERKQTQNPQAIQHTVAE